MTTANATTALIDALEIALSLSAFGIDVEIDHDEAIATVAAPAPVQLATLSIRQLRDMARGRVKGFMQLKKAALIAALQALETPTAAPKGKSRRGGRKARQVA